MIRVHTGRAAHKYRAGTWRFDEKFDQIVFDSRTETIVKRETKKVYGFKFRLTMNQTEELTFIQEYQRSDSSEDADFIILQDIINVVFFLAPSQFISLDLLEFIHTETVQNFLRSLIIYFEYFLKLVEYILVTRDINTTQLQSRKTIKIKRVLSERLTQYRLLAARDYSFILIGEGEMEPFHHTPHRYSVSRTIYDIRFHEAFLAISHQIVWIAMHRRAFDIIDMEHNRLFRSEHFAHVRREKDVIVKRLKFSMSERTLLYGKNYKHQNYRKQVSAFAHELINVTKENQPILWIGKRKYKGTDLRIAQIEAEYIVPDSQLALQDITHGILGHPKRIYNTLLTIDWAACRYRNYSVNYDPHHITRQPYLELPDFDEEKLRQFAETVKSRFEIKTLMEPVPYRKLCSWLSRDEKMRYYKVGGRLIDILSRSEMHLGMTRSTRMQSVVYDSIKRKTKMRKTRSRSNFLSEAVFRTFNYMKK